VLSVAVVVIVAVFAFVLLRQDDESGTDAAASSAAPGGGSEFGPLSSDPRFEAGEDLIVFMKFDATQDQIDAMSVNLNSRPEVDRVDYFDHQAAFDEYQRLFAGNASLSSAVLDPGELPTSFRVTMLGTAQDGVPALVDELSAQPGVQAVATPGPPLPLPLEPTDDSPAEPAPPPAAGPS
jgi:hypothetical protein